MKISVLIPTWQRSHFLKFSLIHLANQTLPKDEYEVIVLDDGSTDITGDVVKKFKDSLNLRYIYFDRRHREGKPIQYRSAGPLLNVGAVQSNGSVLLYVDPEVMLLPDAVEQHYLSHVPGHIIIPPKYIIKDIECPSHFAPYTIKEKQYYHVMGLTFKYWFEHARNFGFYNQNDWVNLEQTYYKFWKIVERVYGEEFTLKAYKKFDFYGFVGSQAGWSWNKEMYIRMRGFDEAFEARWPGQWGGEDSDFMMRSAKLGAQRLENMNIRGIHCYHNKANYDTSKFKIIQELNYEKDANGQFTIPKMDRIAVNLDMLDWGLLNEHRKEMVL